MVSVLNLTDDIRLCALFQGVLRCSDFIKRTGWLHSVHCPDENIHHYLELGELATLPAEAC